MFRNFEDLSLEVEITPLDFFIPIHCELMSFKYLGFCRCPWCSVVNCLIIFLCCYWLLLLCCIWISHAISIIFIYGIIINCARAIILSILGLKENNFGSITMLWTCQISNLVNHHANFFLIFDPLLLNSIELVIKQRKKTCIGLVIGPKYTPLIFLYP